MKKILPFLLFSFTAIHAQPTVEREIEKKVIFFFEKFQPEYMLIHLNAEMFLTGETIWYSAYLYNIPYSVNNLSSIAYVELCKDQKVLSRQKLKLTEGVASGDFSLPQNLATGYYQIRGYSNWMKNLGETGFFERSVLIINPESPIVETSSSPNIDLKAQESSIFHLTENTDNIRGSINYLNKCVLAILNNGTLTLLKSFPQADSVRYFEVSKSQLTNNSIQVALFDTAGVLLFEKNLVLERKMGSIATNKKSYSPRDRMDIIIQSGDSEKLSGIYSVSVREKYQIRAKNSWHETIRWNQLLNSADRNLTWPKEKIIYPKSLGTLDPIPMNIPPLLLHEEKNAPSNIDQDILKMLSRNKIITHVSEAYGITESYTKSNAHRLPSDITYYPKDFTTLPTLEDFFIEIVPQVRVKRIKGVNTIRIRNNDNSNKVYFYPKNPLMVIDGIKKDDPSEILTLDPQDVVSIHIAYKLNTLNSSGIVKLADNGILSIYTNDEPKKTFEENAIYDGFHVSSTFVTPLYNSNNSNKDVIPDLRKHMYWNPGIKGTGKAQVPFYLSDNVGEFIIDVKGIRSDGSMFEIQKHFEVTEPTRN